MRTIPKTRISGKVITTEVTIMILWQHGANARSYSTVDPLKLSFITTLLEKPKNKPENLFPPICFMPSNSWPHTQVLHDPGT